MAWSFKEFLTGLLLKEAPDPESTPAPAARTRERLVPRFLQAIEALKSIGFAHGDAGRKRSREWRFARNNGSPEGFPHEALRQA